ncbi:sugar phosphate isomerase/epimerase family protein, partial [Planctomycetota bacterium]
MRLGGPVFAKYKNPEEWAAAMQELGYTAAYCPVGTEADDKEVRAYADAAAAADIVIAECGAWSNPISKDDKERNEALDKCKKQLELAERIGANCCVNITGSRGPKWDGPCAEDLTPETFDLIVASVQEIIDAVKPTRTYYTLETMPWMYPDSTQSYMELMKAIDREQCAAHMDPVNLVCSPQRYFNNDALIREFCEAFGKRIKSCHAKDILLGQNLTTHLDEVR